MQPPAIPCRLASLWCSLLCTGVFLVSVGATLPDAETPYPNAQVLNAQVESAALAEPAVSDTVIAVIAGDTITAAEFNRVYRRHVTDATPQSSADASPAELSPDAAGGSATASSETSGPSESRKQFLKRYIDFRLKVKAARDQGLDTASSLRDDVNRYRTQIARPRLMEDRVIDPLIRELYDRRAMEIDVSHILIRVDENAAPADTLEAYRSIQSVVDTLEAGAPFADVARARSDDPSAERDSGPGAGGRLGYMTAGRLVKPFEDRMYNTPVGERSDIVRTQYGYHVLFVHDRRPRPTPVRVAHILIRPDSSSAADSTAARALADSLQTVASSGDAAFDSLARAYSDDARSAARGGEIGVLSPDRNVPPVFRDAAFGLESTGDVSGVIETRFGFHILQLLERIPRPAYDEAYESLREQASRLPRFQSQDALLAFDVLEKRGGRIDTSAISNALYGVPNALDSLARPLANPERSLENADRTVLVIGDSTYTLRDMAQAMSQTSRGSRMTLGEALTSFFTSKALAVAASHLEEQDEDFRRQIQEYRDGLLLFEFMQTNVWDPAARDTAGLRAVYEKHPERYRYPDRVRALRFSAAQDTLLPTFAQRYPEDGTSEESQAQTPSPRVSPDRLSNAVADASERPVVRVDTIYVSPDTSTPQQQLFDREDRTVVGPVTVGRERVVFVRLGLEPARQMTFEEARSRVLGDYQEVYEETVLERLRSRYALQSYPERLPTAPSSGQPPTNRPASDDETPSGS